MYGLWSVIAEDGMWAKEEQIEQKATENFITTSIMICIYHQYYQGEQIKENEMGGACSMYGGEEKCIQGFSGET